MQQNINEKWLNYIAEAQKPRYEDLRLRPSVSNTETAARLAAIPTDFSPSSFSPAKDAPSADEKAIELLKALVIKESDQDVSDLLPPPPVQTLCPVPGPPPVSIRPPVPTAAAVSLQTPAPAVNAGSIPTTPEKILPATPVALTAKERLAASAALAKGQPLVTSVAEHSLPSVAELLQKKAMMAEEESPSHIEDGNPPALPVAEAAELPSIADLLEAKDALQGFSPVSQQSNVLKEADSQSEVNSAEAAVPEEEAIDVAMELDAFANFRAAPVTNHIAAPEIATEDNFEAPHIHVTPPAPDTKAHETPLTGPGIDNDPFGSLTIQKLVKPLIIAPPESNVPKAIKEARSEKNSPSFIDDDYDPLAALASLTKQSNALQHNKVNESPYAFEDALSSEATAALQALSAKTPVNPAAKKPQAPAVPKNRQPSPIKSPLASVGAAPKAPAVQPASSTSPLFSPDDLPPAPQPLTKPPTGKPAGNQDFLAGLGDLGGLIVSTSQSKAAPEADAVRRKRLSDKDNQ